METQKEHWIPIIVIILFIAIAGLTYLQDSITNRPTQTQPVTVLELAGPIKTPRAELSGLGWHGNILILLPQHPERFGNGDGALFSITKNEILDVLNGNRKTPLEPALISLVAPGVKEFLKNFRGYKSITFNNNQVFLTAEAQVGGSIQSYLIAGNIEPNSSKIILSTRKVVKIPKTFTSANRSGESLLIEGNSILTLFEVNGDKLNPLPTAHVFDLTLNQQDTISFPKIEFRITDAAAESGNNFWVINYFFPKDSDLATNYDPLALKYNKLIVQTEQTEVERLVEMTYSPKGITLADSPPIQLTLDENNSRNLEGLALLDDKGFLLATNKYPATMLLFVERPK